MLPGTLMKIGGKLAKWRLLLCTMDFNENWW